MRVPSGIVILAITASLGGVLSWSIRDRESGVVPEATTAVVAVIRTPLSEDAPVPEDEGPSPADGMFTAMNSERLSRDIPFLERDGALDALARTQARDMAARGHFDHTNPEGVTFAERMRASGYVYGSAAENIGIAGSWAEIVPNWMSSGGHRDNILNSEFRWAGTGVASGTYQGHPAVFFVAVFAGPR